MHLFRKNNPGRGQASIVKLFSAPGFLVSNNDTLIPLSTEFDAGPEALPVGADLNSPVFGKYVSCHSPICGF